mmetsp:Transcript_9666/g.19725  ORF Transcript_9666/g.19725 Transcript_9666/m.19725 type:complete len:944 (-) Transcript_9666:329-3160(-)|eukprot:CAMPEP_0184686142 /NCGR_PEP_ID=MMETSP0312-20130426/21403_1 /TAXON_ID=31354 /ORGANISM="Compsopogon coeruleus, Strain SAG 36.94" /LENGTH=943 /DNA_ID=CAMNT_0027140923 /DNA_START=70 /DNA_END=2901 /DNA_ORIENTATION=+
MISYWWVTWIALAIVARGQIFINEIHYENSGADQGEAIEVAGPAGENLTGWSVVLYNGRDGKTYQTSTLSGVLLDSGNGYGFHVISYPTNGIQNGAPDGVALVSPSGAVIEFLSYEGSLQATNGPATGMISNDIGVKETSSTTIGYSLQLTGDLGSFMWTGPVPSSFGSSNGGQTFPTPTPSPTTPPPATLFINEIHYDNDGTDVGEAIELAGTMTTSVSGWTLVLYNGANGAVYNIVSLSGSLRNAVDGYGFLEVNFPTNALQNGGPDGIALVDPAGAVTEFISYEGTFTAVGGPADGLTSTSISVSETGTTPVGYSLQLTDSLGAFTWSGPIQNTFGNINTGQSFGGSSPTTPPTTPPTPPPTAQPTSPPAPTSSPAPGLLRIGDVQGASHTSPYVGQQVTLIGVVTAVDTNGFYIQDGGDSNLATSDGILVYTSTTPTVVVGNEVSVTGTVTEYIPGGATSNNLGTTELTSPSITVLQGSVALPNPVILGTGGRLPPRSLIDDDALTSYQPTTDPIDFFESLEGMRVQVKAPRAVSSTSSYGEIFTLVDGADLTTLNSRGSLTITPTRFGSEKVQINRDTGILPGFTFPLVSPGDVLSDVVGVVGYSFGNYEVSPTEAFTVTSSAGLSPTSMIRFGRTSTAMLAASMNVLNLDPTDSATRFTELGQTIVNVLRSPDLIFLQEVQDNDGAANTAVTSASITLNMIKEAVIAAGGPSYSAIDNTFIGDDTNGGQPGGNIRVAYLYDSSRLSLVTGSLGSIVSAQDQQSNPGNPFYNSRLPLTGQFVFLPTNTVFDAVDVHFGSKGGSAPLFGQLQSFELRQEESSVNGGVDKRDAQAQAVADYVSSHPNRKFIVAGDCNEFTFVSPVGSILGGVLDLLTLKISEKERFSYSFQGNAQQIDHAFVSSSLYANSSIEVAHVNSEFSSADPMSDHDFVAFQVNFG